MFTVRFYSCAILISGCVFCEIKILDLYLMLIGVVLVGFFDMKRQRSLLDMLSKKSSKKEGDDMTAACHFMLWNC